MNFRNIIGQPLSGQPDQENEDQEMTNLQNSPLVESENYEGLIHPLSACATEMIPWYESNLSFVAMENNFMAENYPDFSLRVLEDPNSSLDGSLCWHGIICPGIMEDMKWEIILVYQGVGGGKGDWSGAMSIYFADPTFDQIIETLGYVPKCMKKDADSSFTLLYYDLNKRDNSVIKQTMLIAENFCESIEKMCIGELPENFLSDYISLSDNVVVIE